MSSGKGIKDLIAGCSAILLDIEGATTSIEFVKEVLFPFAQKNAGEYLDTTWDSNKTKEIVDDLLLEYTKTCEMQEDVKAKSKQYQLSILVKFIDELIKSDKKMSPLKKLQGYIWKKGYETGDIVGHVYEDVKPRLQEWKEKNLPIYIYSSGSIEAQKLLFKYSVEGDLLEYFSGHFDTTIGQKVDSASYGKIAKAIGIPSESIVFITDLPKEAEEARIAKMNVIISKRPGTVLYKKEVLEFPSISTFDQLSDEARDMKRSVIEEKTDHVKKQKV